MTLFRDREDGGRALARALAKYRGADAVVYGLPRGGVVTAKVVAAELGAPLDLVITRKLGHPDQPEYAVGAISEDGEVVLNERAIAELPPDWLEREKAVQLKEAKRRRAVYLGDRPPLPVRGKIAIIVDDGIATGHTVKAAARMIRRLDPAKLVVAAPVAPDSVAERLVGFADEVVVPFTPADFFAIGQFYRHFLPVEDAEVIALMKETEAS